MSYNQRMAKKNIIFLQTNIIQYDRKHKIIRTVQFSQGGT